MARAVTIAALVVACGSRHAPPPPAIADHPLARDAIYPTVSHEITFITDHRPIPGTLTLPQAPGRWPALVLLAGSGPTDRDWGSPLLATNNGSGKLLAAELASRGAVVLRFDKAGAGKNTGPPLPEITLDTYRDEALAAIAFVRARAEVRGDRVFVAGHSEGGAHATRVALVAQPPVAGVIYLSSVSRPMGDTMLDQLEGNLRTTFDPTYVREAMPALRTAFTDFLAGRPVDPQKASALPQLQAIVAGLVRPVTAQLMRDLLRFDNSAVAPRLAVPVFIASGGKDVQIDPELDARRLDRAFRSAHRDVTLHISPDADHVLKHEPKPLAALRADLVSVQNNYNAYDRPLDADVVAALVTWLADRTR
ncbi:MAG: alpha/beta fold hydrolase [Kofleriaceae bacterium]